MKLYLSEEEQRDQYDTINRLETKIDSINKEGCDWAEQKITSIYRFISLAVVAIIGAIATTWFK